MAFDKPQRFENNAIFVDNYSELYFTSGNYWLFDLIYMTHKHKLAFKILSSVLITWYS